MDYLSDMAFNTTFYVVLSATAVIMLLLVLWYMYKKLRHNNVHPLTRPESLTDEEANAIANELLNNVNGYVYEYPFTSNNDPLPAYEEVVIGHHRDNRTRTNIS